MHSQIRFPLRAVQRSRVSLIILLTFIMLATGFSLIVTAAVGDPDLSFSTNGWQTTDFFSGQDVGLDVALQSDGKVVVVGYSTKTGHTDFALARYNTDGSPDTTFSGDGKQTTDFVGEDYATGVAIQSNGKIVVAGYTINSNGQIDFALARYNTTGTLDTTFNRTGKVKTNFKGGADQAFAVAIQTDGKIVAVGQAETAPGSNNYDFALARYNTNGSLDNTFDTDGRQTTDFVGKSDRASDVAILQNGKILAAGRDYLQSTATNSDFALARYNSNGSLDMTFSGDGKQTTDFGRTTDFGNALVIQPDQKPIVVGFSLSGTAGYRFALARYNTNGTLDTTFSGDGKQISTFSGTFHQAIIYDAVLQSNGRLVVAGNACDDNFLCDAVVARYNTNGVLDTSFSGDGKVIANFGGDEDALAVALQGDGKIIVAGSLGPSDLTLSGYDFMVARFLGNATALAAPSDSANQAPEN